MALAFTPLMAQANGNMTQAELLRWFAQLTASEVEDSELVEWAKSQGISPNSGWNLGAHVSESDMSLLLVQLFGYNPKKHGGNHSKTLQRDGISIDFGDDGLLSRSEFASMVDNFGFVSRLTGVSKSRGSGVNGDLGHPGNILPPGFRNPRNPHFEQFEPGGPNDPRPGGVGLGNNAR